MTPGRSAGLSIAGIFAAWSVTALADRALGLPDVAALILFIVLALGVQSLLWRRSRQHDDPDWLSHYGRGWAEWSRRWSRWSAAFLLLSAITTTCGIALSEASLVPGLALVALGVLLLGAGTPLGDLPLFGPQERGGGHVRAVWTAHRDGRRRAEEAREARYGRKPYS